MNIKIVQNNLGALKEIGETSQQSSESAKINVMEQPVENVNTALNQMYA